MLIHHVVGFMVTYFGFYSEFCPTLLLLVGNQGWSIFGDALLAARAFEDGKRDTKLQLNLRLFNAMFKSLVFLPLTALLFYGGYNLPMHVLMRILCPVLLKLC
eukprot:UN20708